MTPEQEIVADLMEAANAVARSARETLQTAGDPPLNDAQFEAMSPLQRLATTALLKQFEQLEGLLNSLFRAILRTMGVRLKGLYPRDIANRMADLGVLDDADRWFGVVKLRNELVHEHPLGSSERYDRFAQALKSLPFLFSVADRTEQIIDARELLGRSE